MALPAAWARAATAAASAWLRKGVRKMLETRCHVSFRRLRREQRMLELRLKRSMKECWISASVLVVYRREQAMGGREVMV